MRATPQIEPPTRPAETHDVTALARPVLQAPGTPLPAAARTALGPRLGHRFGDVRVHSDDEASRSARALGAAGYSYGHHVVVDARRDPGQLAGTLEHELAHVAQTRHRPHSPPPEIMMRVDDREREREAEAASSAPGAQTSVELSGPAVLRRQEASRAALPAPPPSPDALDWDETMLVGRWLSRWEIDGREGSLLAAPRLGPSHDENISRIAAALWQRRLERRGLVDPRLLLQRGQEAPAGVVALRDGPVRALYERTIRIQEQALSPGEEAFIESSVGGIGAGSGPLTGDRQSDTTALTETILCGRSSLTWDAPLDPLFCMSADVTKSNPVFVAFRAGAVAPVYDKMRTQSGRLLAQAMAEGRLTAGAHAFEIRQMAETGSVRIGGSTIVPSLGLLRLLEALVNATPPPTGRTPDFGIISLIRPGEGAHGKTTERGVKVGRAVDIGRFAGHLIDITEPEHAVAGVAAVIEALPPGCYSLGLPRPPRRGTDPASLEGADIDFKEHQRFYRATTIAPAMPALSPRGLRARATNPFFPAGSKLRVSPSGGVSVAADLAKLGPGSREPLTKAVEEAQKRGARILLLFPDGPDHLHVEVMTCPVPRKP